MGSSIGGLLGGLVRGASAATIGQQQGDIAGQEEAYRRRLAMEQMDLARQRLQQEGAYQQGELGVQQGDLTLKQKQQLLDAATTGLSVGDPGTVPQAPAAAQATAGASGSSTALGGGNVAPSAAPALAAAATGGGAGPSAPPPPPSGPPVPAGAESAGPPAAAVAGPQSPAAGAGGGLVRLPGGVTYNPNNPQLLQKAAEQQIIAKSQIHEIDSGDATQLMNGLGQPIGPPIPKNLSPMDRAKIKIDQQNANTEQTKAQYQGQIAAGMFGDKLAGQFEKTPVAMGAAKTAQNYATWQSLLPEAMDSANSKANPTAFAPLKTAFAALADPSVTGLRFGMMKYMAANVNPSLGDKAQTAYLRLMNGQSLTPQDVQSMDAVAKKIVADQQSRYTQQRDQWAGQHKNAAAFIQDPGFPQPAAPGGQDMLGSAKAAIQNGAEPTAVKARYKQLTGHDFDADAAGNP